MNRHHGANKLPVELLSLVFDSLSLDELLLSSHVSTYWRSVAWRHSTFWRDITLAAASPSAITFFLVRLTAGSTRSVVIHLYVPPLEFPALQRAIVFSTVTENLYRIDKLDVEFDVPFEEELFLALNHPAPRLRTLDLAVVDDDHPSDALPVELFASQAPCLRHVRLTSVRLREDRLPRVFSSLTELRYCFGEASFPTAVFSHCPALETLVIYGEHCSLQSAGGEACTITPGSLQSVDVAVRKGGSDLMQRLPCTSIPSVTVMLQDQPAIYDLLDHLRGPLELRVEREPDAKNIDLDYLALDTGMQRCMRCSPVQATLSTLPSRCVSEHLMSRVQSVQATANCTGLFPTFRELASCTRVSLSLHDGQRLEPPPEPLSLPKLERVELSSATPQSLDAGDLEAFLAAAFTAGSDAVQVTLAGVTLGGNIDLMPRNRFVVSSAAHT
ncbi:hypothetical protein AURDEDRAFT_183988 [Auricularia subglabra TFB-10046 SS5]|nr:hypothetical protein AURDEDRAFT_183988 [Auricularia subglabra TFB-10046 SS5]